MGTQEIYNYRKVDDDVITGGQPLEEQLQAAAQEGFKTVINLAPHNSRNSLPDEAGLVKSLGMTYTYIPVDWGKPTEQDFEAFESAMQQRPEGKTLIHCQANFRVTAFYSLYALKNLGWSAEQAEKFRASIWMGSDYPTWDEFISDMTAKIEG